VLSGGNLIVEPVENALAADTEGGQLDAAVGALGLGERRCQGNAAGAARGAKARERAAIARSTNLAFSCASPTPAPGRGVRGSTSLVDVVVGCQSHEEAIGRPVDGPSLPLMDLTIDADRATLLMDHRKHDPVVEDDELLDFEAKLGERAEPFVQEATNCRSAFEGLDAPRKERIGSEEAHYRVDVTPIHSLEDNARKLSGAGDRGLLRHRAVKYPGPLPSQLKPSVRAQPRLRPLRRTSSSPSQRMPSTRLPREALAVVFERLLPSPTGTGGHAT
jgi:hypothetical protein